MFKNKKPLLFVCCFAFILSLTSFHKPIYIAIYKWKEPRFITPLYLEDGTFNIREDGWGEGHFGAKRKGGRKHRGIDITANIGTEVYAAKSGRASCCNQPRGMGKYIIIQHPDGYSTLYGHLKDWSIKSNTWVRQGQTIGVVGKSGNADIARMQAHLHFEIRNQDKPVDPEEYLDENADKGE